MKILWTEPAIEDLRNLHSYIAKDSEVYASSFVERIILAVERLPNSQDSAVPCPKPIKTQFENSSITTTELYIV